MGYTLAEVTLLLLLVALCAAFAVPVGSEVLQRRRLQAAVRHVASTCKLVRLKAALSCRYYGIWFRSTDEGYRFAVYEDGNGNGIRKQEILEGTDPQITREELLGERFSGISFRILDQDDIPNIPPSSGTLPPGDPLHIGRSDILSFSPLGQSTSGTLYISSSKRMAALRIFGPTCRIRIWEYDPIKKEWHIWN